jgi:hypothetical protein
MDNIIPALIFGPFLAAASLFGVGIALLAWRFVVKVWSGSAFE